MISCAIRESVRATCSASSRTRCAGGRGRVRHSTPFRPRWTGLKGDVRAQHTRTGRTARRMIYIPRSWTGELLERYAKLIVEVGANIQRDQQVLVIAAPDLRAARPRDRGRVLTRGERGSSTPGTSIRTSSGSGRWRPTPTRSSSCRGGIRSGSSTSARRTARASRSRRTTPPGLMDGVDPAVAGRDQLPSLREHFEVINAKTTNWCVVPWATEAWATVVHPELAPADALAKLNERARLPAAARRA